MKRSRLIGVVVMFLAIPVAAYTLSACQKLCAQQAANTFQACYNGSNYYSCAVQAYAVYQTCNAGCPK